MLARPLDHADHAKLEDFLVVFVQLQPKGFDKDLVELKLWSLKFAVSFGSPVVPFCLFKCLDFLSKACWCCCCGASPWQWQWQWQWHAGHGPWQQ